MTRLPFGHFAQLPASISAVPASSRRAAAVARAVAFSIGLLAAPWALAQTVAPVTDPKPEDPVELSPFVVATSKDVGYQATNTLAGTRLNTNLKDIGAAVSVYTQEFLEDINVSKLQDILTFTAGTEVGGQNGNFSGVTGESSAEVRDDPSSVNRVRALAQATRTRDFFATDLPGDAYNFDTITVSRGPNAVLAGVGNAGGIIDSSLRKATFANNARVVSRFSSYGSHREELHFNKVLVPGRLAIRLDLLNDEKKYRQQPAYETDRRLYGAVQYRVFEPKRGGVLGRGTLRANVETGNIDGVPPDPLTPTFTVGNWFNALNPKWQWNGALQQLQTSSGAPLTGTVAQTGVYQGFPLYAQWALIYSNPSSGVAGLGSADASLANLQGFQGTIPAAAAGGPGGALRGTGDPARSNGKPGYLRTHLIDPRIFNFYDHLLTGVFDHRSQTFNASDFRYEQLLLGGKAGFEAAYNYQTFTRRRDFPIPGSGDDEGIFVDVNSVLSIRTPAYPNGVPNPNFGRPFISTPDVFRDQMNRTTRESYQLTAFFNQDFSKSETRWARALGRHTLSGLLFKTNIERFNRTYGSTWDPSGPLNPFTNNSGVLPGLFGAQVNGWFYLGPSMLSANSVSDVRLQPISAERPQYGQSYTVRIYDSTTRSFVTGSAKPIRVLNRLVDQREELNSSAVALQSHWLKDYVTTIVGWREDRDEGSSSLTPARLANGNLDESAVTFQPSIAQGKRSWTKSVVGRLPVRLPGDTELRAFWSESGNFTPGGQRRNIWNEEVGSPAAETTEQGVSISTFNGKFFLKVNRFDTRIQNDAVSGVRNAFAYISSTINNMVQANLGGLAPSGYGYTTASGGSPYANFEQVARALYDTIPKRLRIGSEYNFNPRLTGSGAGLQWVPDSITGLVSTSDTKSTGTEFEAIVNPLSGWRVAFSVTENEAVKADVARQELAFANEWVANVRAKDGGALINGQRNPVQSATLGTFLAQYDGEHTTFIRTSAAQSGVSTAEVRKWRANVVTRYEFQRGLLRGVSVGGALRWQDRVGVGYPNLSATPNTQYLPDIAHPLYGPRDTQVDLSLGYRHRFKVRGAPITWNVGVNVRNLTAKDTLIPIAANPDGTWATFRIPPERTWSVANSFAF
ncbi:TonB-dependent receptor plug domain-containing protein [Horticoccus sp. 23ND18S-11]|uniref:TonB-dependent receptor plug domain-containing protein n=1 Tax=Horticoccus sp. 23ND18S-11 TaxID=3391832 RepID=UPI0039C904B8